MKVKTQIHCIGSTDAHGSSLVCRVHSWQRLLVFGLVILGLGTRLLAQTWNGAGTNDSWSTVSNWVGNVAPVSDGTALVTFGGSTRLTPNANTTWDIKGIRFTNGASAFTLSGSTLTLRGSGITNLSSSLQTINNNIIMNGVQTWNAASGNLLVGGTVDNGGSLLTAAGANNLTIDGVISGTGGLTKVDAGTLTLSGANTFSGTLTLSAGTLALGHNTAAGTGGLTIGGGTIQATGGARTLGNAVTASGNFIVAGSQDLTFTNTISFAADRTITVNNSGLTTFAGSLLRGSGTPKLIKAGSGTLVLSASNNIVDTITVSAGALRVSHGDALGSTAQGTVVSSGAALQLQGGIAVGAEGLTLSGNGIANDGALRNISGNNSWSGALTLGANSIFGSDAGRLTLSGNIDNNAKNLTLSGSGDFTLSGILSGNGDLTNNSTGTVVISGTNTYTGITVINAGVVSAQNSAAFGTAGGVAVASGAELQLQGGIAVGNQALTLNGSGTAGNGALRNVSGANSWSGALTLGSATTIGSDAGTLTLSGNLNNGGYGLTLLGAGDLTASGILSGTGALTKNGSGTLTLTRVNTYSGGSTLNGGTIVINNGASLGNASGAATLNAATLKASASFTSTRNLTLGSASSTLEVDPAVNWTLTGVVSGSGTLNKTGTGTLTLSNANTFAGGLVVNAGTLAFGHDNSASTGTVTVGSATLQAAGTAHTITNTLVFTDNPTFGGSLDMTFSAHHALTANRTFTVDNTGLTAFTGVMSDSGGARTLTKGGSGTLLLSGANTFSGGTILNAGMLALGHNQAAGTGTLTLNGGALRADTAARTLTNTLTVSGDVAVGGSQDLTLSGAGTLTGNRTLNITNTGLTTFSGALGQDVAGRSLAKTGSGSLLLSGANTYSGGFTHSAGVLQVGHNNALGSGTFTLNDATIQSSGTARQLTNAFVLGGDAIVGGTLDLTLSGAGTLTGNRTLNITNSGLTTISGALGQDVAGRTLTKTGAGTLLLSGANTYSGGLTLSAGTLQVGNNSAAGLGTLTISGGTIQASGGARTLGNALNASGNFTIGGSQDLTFTNTVSFIANRTITVDNTGLTTFAGSLLTTGGPKLTKAGTGTLVLSASNNITDTIIVSAGALRAQHNNALGTVGSATTVSDGGVLELAGDIAIGAEPLTLSGSGVSSGGALRNVSGNNSFSGDITLGAASSLASDSGTMTLSGLLDNGGFLATFQGAGNITVTNIVSGSGGLAKNGAGTLTLTAANAYTGASSINAGVVKIQTATGFGSSAGGVTVASGAELQLQGGIAVGNEALTLNGSGTAGNGALRNVSGTNSWSGDVTLGSATTIGSDAGRLTLSGNLNNAGYGLTFLGAGDVTASGVLSGAGNLTKNGAGTLTLSEVNTYTGGSTINAGTVVINNAASLGNASFAANLNAATLKSTASFTSARNLTLGAATSTLEVNPSVNWTVTGVVSGSGTLNKTGAGTLTLSNANTFAGGLVVNAGTLAFGNDNSASTGTVTVGAATLQAVGAARTITNTLVVTDNATFGGALDLTFTSPIALTGDRTFTVDNTGLTTLSGVLSDSGGVRTLTKNGSGTLLLSGANTFSGGFTLNAGMVALGHNQAVGSGALALNGGALRADTAARTLTNTLTLGGDVTVGGALDLTLSGTGTLTGNRTLNITNSGLTTFSGALGQDTAGRSLTKTGTGSLQLSGANTFSGGVTLSAGTLQVGNNSAAGTGTLIINANTTIQGDGTARTLGNAVTAAGNFTVAGTSDLTFTGAMSFTSDRTITVNNSGLTTFAGSLLTTGGPKLTKAGSGTLVLSASNNITDTITVSAGALRIQNNNALGNTTSGTTVSSGAALEMVGNIAVTAEPLTLSGTGVSGGGALRNISGTNSFAGALTLDAGTLVASDAGKLTLSGTIDNGGFWLTNASVGEVELSGIISGSGGLVQDGSGVLTLSGSGVNIHTGDTTVKNGMVVLNKTSTNGAIIDTITIGDSMGAAGTAIVRHNASNQIDSGGGSGITIRTDGWLDLNGYDDKVKIVTVQGGKVTTGAGTLTLVSHVTFAATNQTATISGNVNLGANRDFTVNDGPMDVDVFVPAILSGAYNFEKKGAGTLVLGGANTHSGGTTFKVGTLGVSNDLALGTGTFTVAAGTVRAEGAARTVTNTLDLTSFTVGGSNDLTFAGNGTLAADLTVTADNTGITTFSGALSGAGFTFSKAGTGTLVLSGANTHDETYVNAGVLNIRNATALSGTTLKTVVADGAALEVQGGIAIGSEALELYGSGISSGGALRNVSSDNSWAGNITLKAAATLGSDSGTLTHSGSLINGGFLATYTGAGNITESGIISGTGGLTKTGVGTLTLSGTSNNTFSGAVTVNQGSLVLSKASGSNAFAGTLTVGDGTGGANADIVRLGADNQIPTVAVAVNSSGWLDLNGYSDTVGALTMTGGNVSSGAGTLTLGGNVTGNAASTAATISGNLALGTNRTFTIADGSAATDMDVSAIISGGFALAKEGAGTLALSGTNTFSGGASINAGTVAINNSASLGNTASAATISNATLRATDTFTSTRNLTMGAANSTIEVEGTKIFTVNGVMSGNGGLVKTGNGTLIVGGNNTFTNRLKVDAGTLLLGNNNRITDTVGVTLNGGTLATGGYNETVGKLTLTADSILDLGSGATVLQFAGSSNVTWTGSTTLTIVNWSGSTSGGGTDQIYFGSNSGGLTWSQLGQIRFLNSSGNYEASTLLATGELAPAPEPATWAGIVVVVGLLTWRERKHLGRLFRSDVAKQ